MEAKKKQSTENFIKDIRRKTRRLFSSEYRMSVKPEMFSQYGYWEDTAIIIAEKDIRFAPLREEYYIDECMIEEIYKRGNKRWIGISVTNLTQDIAPRCLSSSAGLKYVNAIRTLISKLWFY